MRFGNSCSEELLNGNVSTAADDMFPVTGDTVNTLAETPRPVTITVKEDTSNDRNVP